MVQKLTGRALFIIEEVNKDHQKEEKANVWNGKKLCSKSKSQHSNTPTERLLLNSFYSKDSERYMCEDGTSNLQLASFSKHKTTMKVFTTVIAHFNSSKF